MTMQYYTVEQIGPKQEWTPEGYLLCRDVPIARVGTMTYRAHELPKLKPDEKGFIVVDRNADDVFTPSAIASFEGKPIVDNHPMEGRINTKNWMSRSVGVVLRPRRGDGVSFDNDFMYGDMMFTDPAAIEAVRTKAKRDVSAGYDAEYEQLAPGRARQYNIVGNHVALVSNGRCGPQCAIGDAAMPDGGHNLRGGLRRVRRALNTQDSDTAVQELDRIDNMIGQVVSDDDEGGNGENHRVVINVNGAAGGAPSAPPVTGDRVARRRRSTRDAEGDPDNLDPDNGESGGGDLEQRIGALEDAVAMIAEFLNNQGGDEPENPDEGEDGFGGDMSHDTVRHGYGRRPPGLRGRGTRDSMESVDEARARLQAEMDELDLIEQRGRRNNNRNDNGNNRAMVGDSTSLEPEFNHMIAVAKVLAPTFSLPTLDSRQSARVTHGSMCEFRRSVLDHSYRTEAGKKVIDSLLGNTPANFPRMTCDVATMVFNGAGEIMRTTNDHATSSNHVGNPRVNGSTNGSTNGGTPPVRLTPADINKRNQEFYKTTV